MIIYHLKDQSELESRNWLKIKKIQNFGEMEIQNPMRLLNGMTIEYFFTTKEYRTRPYQTCINSDRIIPSANGLGIISAAINCLIGSIKNSCRS